jgi:hypothetical protein
MEKKDVFFGVGRAGCAKDEYGRKGEKKNTQSPCRKETQAHPPKSGGLYSQKGT